MLEKIQKVLKDVYNVDTAVKWNDLVGDNKLIKVQIEPPRANCPSTDEHYKWLLRMAPSESFDRWSVSAAISERFDEPWQIAEFLSNACEVYKSLFNKLSENYKELNYRFTDMEYGKWDK